MLRINKLWSPPGLLILAILGALGGCSNNPYTITFNDNIMYSPNNVLRNSLLSDPALQACLNQLLASEENSSATQIKLLACPGAGIKTLEGIGALEALEQLELSDNDIDNLSPLQPLHNLRVLGIRNNDVSNIGTLNSLPLLRFVSLQGNKGISCRQLDELGLRLGNTLTRPLDCIK